MICVRFETLVLRTLVGYFSIPLIFYICTPLLLRTTMFAHNRFPQENVNVHKSCKNQHDHLIMCCVHPNDQIIDFLYTKIMKIDEK